MTIKDIREKLESQSPSFCLAKWYRTNLRLDTGLTYSCHHSLAHSINTDQIKEDPSKLTNTDYIIERRKEMLSGKKPNECNYCWSVEDSGNYSDRLNKSRTLYDVENEKGKRNLFEESTNNLNVVPSTLEISFDNTCNLKCAYCTPAYSSKWEEEYNQYGPYPTKLKRRTSSNKILNKEHNPYIEAFWKWWPELKENLETLRITGGEPLLSKNTYKVLDMIIESDSSFNIHLNSNLSVNIDSLLERLKKPVKCFDKFVLNVSLESNKEQGEYSRFGLDYDLFDSNIHKYLQRTNNKLIFMNTINILSITSYNEFISYVKNLRKIYGKHRISFAPVYMRYPEYLNIRILPKNIKEQITEETNFRDPDLTYYENLKIRALIDYMNGSLDNDKSLQCDFVKFINEYDRRRNTNFIKVYPNLAHLLEDWK